MAPKKPKGARSSRSIFPIDQLPQEILGEIFRNCMQGERGPLVPVPMLRRAAPLLPCSICSSWRELALAMPELWDTVGLVIRNPDIDPSDSAHIINTWLERSKSLPLTLYLGQLSLVYDVPLSKTNPALVKSILSVFYSHSSRWQHVTLSLFETKSLSFPRLDTPLLESFDLSGPWQKPIRFPFSESPRLTRLSWPFPLDPTKNPQIPWSQLRDLRISAGMTVGMTLSSALETIRSCPQLEEFFGDCPGITEDDVGLPLEPKVENRRLRALEIYVYEDISPFLQSLTLPALEAFACSFPNAEEEEPQAPMHESFLDFLTRSNCKLKKLKLSHCGFSASEFMECLEHKASEAIKKLSIAEWPKLTDEMLTRLTDSPSTIPRVLLPKLTHLTLEYCLDASPGMLGELVLSRYHPPAGVEQLEVLVLASTDLDEEDETMIEDAAADGLDTRITLH